jgi:N-acylneuraminate cytidylyltransferase
MIGGLPMIAHPISMALKANVFDRIYVSTDSEKIAHVAKEYGAEVPFIRNTDLADDFTPTIPVIRDAISKIKHIQSRDFVCCVYPTSIFLKSEILSAAKSELDSLDDGQFLVSITSFDYPIQRALIRNDNNELNFLNPAYSQSRSQDLKETFHDAAQFYWATAETWATADNVFQNARGIYIGRGQIQDIDTLEDFERASTLLRIQNEQSQK